MCYGMIRATPSMTLAEARDTPSMFVSANAVKKKTPVRAHNLP